MDKSSALKILKVSSSATEHEITKAYQQKKIDLLDKINNATNQTVVNKYNVIFEKLEQAYQVVLKNAAVPKQAKQQTSTNASSNTVQSASALKALGLQQGVTAAEINAAFENKKSNLEGKKAQAATPALAAKFDVMLQKIEQAYVELTSQQTSANPSSSNQSSSKQAASNIQTNSQQSKATVHSSPKVSSSPLSQTKLADLPGMAGHDISQVELQPGEEIADRYQIKELIGQGGMGAVYRAFDKNRSEDIAIKVLLPSLTKNERALERFLNEARVSSMLSHPNIINVFDVQTHEQCGAILHFLTMELLEGQDLRQVMDNQKAVGRAFDIEDVKEYIDGICIGLANAHETTVHRDIKPENIWIGSNGKIKLMDFGIAQLQSSSQRTQTGAAMGTAYYMAPEQLRGLDNINGRADQYAVAVLAYELLTGEVPAGAIEPIGEVRTDIPGVMADAIMQALSPRAERRFEDINAFNQAIQNSKGGKPKRKIKPQKHSSVKHSHLHTAGPNKLVIGAVVLIALLGLGFAGSQGYLDFLKPVDKELLSSQQADASKLQGKIKVLKKRFEQSIRDIKTNYKEAQRSQKDIWYYENYHNLAVGYLENGDHILNLEGEQSSGEMQLRTAKNNKEMGRAINTLNHVVDSWQEINDKFALIATYLVAYVEIDAAITKWNEHIEKYPLQNTPNSITVANSLVEKSNEFIEKGNFSESIDSLVSATSKYQQAIDETSEEVAAILLARKKAVQAKNRREKKEQRKTKGKEYVKKINNYLYDIESGSGHTRYSGTLQFSHEVNTDGQCILEGKGRYTESSWYSEDQYYNVSIFDPRYSKVKGVKWSRISAVYYLIGYKLVVQEGAKISVDKSSHSVDLSTNYKFYVYLVDKSGGVPNSYSLGKSMTLYTDNKYKLATALKSYLELCGMTVN